MGGPTTHIIFSRCMLTASVVPLFLSMNLTTMGTLGTIEGATLTNYCEAWPCCCCECFTSNIRLLLGGLRDSGCLSYLSFSRFSDHLCLFSFFGSSFSDRCVRSTWSLACLANSAVWLAMPDVAYCSFLRFP